MLQITITDPTPDERNTLRELLDHWPVYGDLEYPQPFAEVPEVDWDAAQKAVDPIPSGPITGITEERPDHDKDGFPWDERIHSSNRQLTQEGCWRKRRGVSEDLIRKVEAELRGAPTEIVPPPPPQTTTTNPMGSFIALLGRIMPAIAEETFTQQHVDQVCLKHGVSSLAALGQKPELVAVIEKELFPS